MNNFATPFGLPVTAPDLARRFAMILAGLAALVARRFLKMPHLAGFTVLLWGRLNRAVRRFHRALTIPAKVRGPRTQADRGKRVRVPALPSRRGWLVRELGWEAAAYMAQLEALLTEAATQSELARAPGTGRILRPICWMLGVAAAVVPKMGVAPATGERPGWIPATERELPDGLSGVCAFIETS